MPSDAHLGVTATSVTDNTKSFTATVAITAMRNGGEIAFETFRDGNREIYVVKVDGSGVLNLTNNLASDGFPVWSPDGTKLAFHRNGEIYAMNADGSGQLNLTNNPAFDCCAVWSADGKKLAFQSTRDDGGELYVMNADGSGVIRLTNNLAPEFAHAWSPDGTKLTFYSDPDGNQLTELVLRNRGRAQPSEQQQGEEGEEDHRADKPQLLAEHAENVVGGLGAQVVELGLRAMHETLAEEAARADANLSLQDVEARAHKRLSSARVHGHQGHGYVLVDVRLGSRLAGWQH